MWGGRTDSAKQNGGFCATHQRPALRRLRVLFRTLIRVFTHVGRACVCASVCEAILVFMSVCVYVCMCESVYVCVCLSVSLYLFLCLYLLVCESGREIEFMCLCLWEPVLACVCVCAEKKGAPCVRCRQWQLYCPGPRPL